VAPRTIRRLVIAVFVIGIAGMIAGSIADDNGVAVTFGLLTAAAAVGLILVTASAPPGAFTPAGAATRPPEATDPSSPVASEVDPDQAGQAIEEQVTRLVAAGADERDVRELVRRAVTFGRVRR
jgi:hypothetical protein